MKPHIPFHRILATTALCLAAMGLNSCQKNLGTLSLAEARYYLSRPDMMSRGIDYLGSDAEFHYFEHKRDLAQDVRFRISVSEDIYSPQETMPYRSWFPDRRDAYTELKEGSMIVFPDLSCGIDGTYYASPAAVPSELWPKVVIVLITDKRSKEARKMEQQIAPYLQESSDVRYIYPLSGLPAYLLPSLGKIQFSEDSKSEK